MNANAPNLPSLVPLLDDAERILATGMPAVIAHAIIDLARRGADLQTAAVGVSADRDRPADVALLTTREAAERLRVSEKQIYRLVAQGRLKRFGVGRRHTFRAGDLTDLLARSPDALRATRAARIASEERRAG